MSTTFLLLLTSSSIYYMSVFKIIINQGRKYIYILFVLILLSIGTRMHRAFKYNLLIPIFEYIKLLSTKIAY